VAAVYQHVSDMVIRGRIHFVSATTDARVPTRRRQGAAK
jgi:hypothetical protein